MLNTFRKLYKVNLVTPRGLYSLLSSLFNSGINLTAMLRFAAKLHPKEIAIVDEYAELTYQELLTQTEQLAIALQEQYGVAAKQKVAIICRNHSYLVMSLFAVSQLGADIYLLNAEMSLAQFRSLINKHNFDLIIHDASVSEMITNSTYNKKKIISNHSSLPSISSLSRTPIATGQKIKKASFGKIVVLSGGTTGNAKTAERKPSVFNFLNPFFALLTKLNLDQYKSVYIATPIYHGFGIASLFISILLGSKIYLLQKFDAQKACSLINSKKIEVITLVPLMLFRMLNHNTEELKSLQCIISGGAPLNPALVQKTFDSLGHKLFNLYGTSEAGFSVLATPADLNYSSNTIGKAIQGVTLKILNTANAEVENGTIGRLCIKSKWAIKGSNVWIETGDLGFKDKNGYYFLKGRNDDMIVSGGENVYPMDLENILIQHPDIKQVAVIGIKDEEFGQRLKAFMVIDNNLTKDDILNWLSTRVARFQIPKQIEFLTDIPYSSLGKPDKKGLV